MTQTLETLVIGGVQLSGIVSHSDTSKQEALTAAGTMLKQYGQCFEAALVDGEKGLVIFDPLMATRPQRPDSAAGFWLRTPTCGSKGNLVLLTATILSLFGFGRPEEIYKQINHGGTGTPIQLTKLMNARPSQ